MRRLHCAITLLIAFIFAYVATPRESAELHAQVGRPCDCVWQGGVLGPVTKPCLGTGNMSAITCNQIGNQCFIGGIATWAPLPANCLYTGSTMGAITAMAFGSGGPSYFDPSVNQTSIPWGVVSADCSGVAFGAVMQVVHDTWTTGSNCACTSGTATTTSVVYGLWRCNAI